MTDQGTAFLRSIAQSPEDIGLRLIFADWLEDNQEPPTKCRECGGLGSYTWPSEDGGSPVLECNTCKGAGFVADAKSLRAEFIRVQCELAEKLPQCNIQEALRLNIPPARLQRELGIDVLQRRERELLDKEITSIPDGDKDCAEGWSGGKRSRHWGIATFRALDRSGLLYNNPDDSRRMEWEFRRGFVEHVTLSWQDWSTHAKAIRAAAPIREVTLTDRPPLDVTIPEPFIDSNYSRWCRFLGKGFKAIKIPFLANPIVATDRIIHELLKAEYGERIKFNLP